MSTTKRDKVTRQMLQDEQVDPHLKKQSLQTAIYDVTKRNPFIGSIIQCLDIEYSHVIPRLGIMFDADGKKWKMMINPFYYCNQLTQDQRAAVLFHEISHVTHKHPLRVPFLKINSNRRHLMNIAMDMVINQYIPNLPVGCNQCPPLEAQYQGEQCPNEMCPGRCILVEDYYDTNDKGKKTQWPENKTFEYYYEKLIERFKDAQQQPQGGDGDGEGGEGGQGGQPQPGDGDGMPQEYDSHNWDSGAEESEVLDATEELVKRAVQKQGLSYDKLPQHIRELLDDIEARRAELNYRALILQAIKRNASGFDRVFSWTRKSRRFGLKAPGTKNGEMPFLSNYIDTSGSISIQEANDFLEVIDNFLKVGSRKCNLSLWHTKVYHQARYRLGDRLDRAVFQSGGTDMEDTLRAIKREDPDLAIVLTDGCYCDVDVEAWLKPNENFPQTLFIISRDGMEDHPFKDRTWSETIKIPNTDHYGGDKRLEEQ